MSDDSRLVSVGPWRCECGHEARDLREMKKHRCPRKPVQVVMFPPRCPECHCAKGHKMDCSRVRR